MFCFMPRLYVASRLVHASLGPGSLALAPLKENSCRPWKLCAAEMPAVDFAAARLARKALAETQYRISKDDFGHRLRSSR